MWTARTATRPGCGCSASRCRACFLLSSLSAAERLLHRDDLHGDVAHFGEEAIEYRAAEKDVEARAHGLSEDDVRDALLLRKADQRVGDILFIQGDDLCAKVLGHAAIFFDALK